MEVKSNSPYIKVNEENKSYYINYGTLKQGADTTVEIYINDVKHLTASKSCQCTQPQVEVTEDGVKITIKYDTNKVGTINQWVKEKVEENGEQREIRFDLRGQII